MEQVVDKPMDTTLYMIQANDCNISKINMVKMKEDQTNLAVLIIHVYLW